MKDKHHAGTDGLLVSCLMVTLPVAQRFTFACESIAAFCRQSFSRKELVVVLNGGVAAGRQKLIDHIATIGRADIRVVNVPGELPLGALRNISLEEAGGDIVCQWDDDDLHHPQRLEHQIRMLLDGDYDAIFLRDVLQYVPRGHSLYWTNWGATSAGGHPGTLVMRSRASVRYPSDGPSARLGEDLCVALALKSQFHVGYLEAVPHLFVYVSHGGNSWNAEHHRRLVGDLAISSGLLRRREGDIRKGLAQFAFARDNLKVVGNNGLAFTI